MDSLCRPDNMLLKRTLHLTWVKLLGPTCLRFAIWAWTVLPTWTQICFIGYKCLSSHLEGWMNSQCRKYEVICRTINISHAISLRTYTETRCFGAVCFFLNLDIWVFFNCVLLKHLLICSIKGTQYKIGHSVALNLIQLPLHPIDIHNQSSIVPYGKVFKNHDRVKNSVSW